METGLETENYGLGLTRLVLASVADLSVVPDAAILSSASHTFCFSSDLNVSSSQVNSRNCHVLLKIIG